MLMWMLQSKIEREQQNSSSTHNLFLSTCSWVLIFQNIVNITLGRLEGRISPILPDLVLKGLDEAICANRNT